jgi:hypothetical protein
MKIADLLHAQPTELRPANGAHHVIARPVVHLHDQNLTPRTGFDVISCKTTLLGERSTAIWSFVSYDVANLDYK